MGLPNGGASIARTGAAGAMGMTVLPQLDSYLSLTLTVSGLVLLTVVLGLKVYGWVRNRREEK